jgi:transcriptional regulator with XRE-family HTH domain
MNSLGEKIRYFRKLRGFSQEELAHELDISLTAYSKIERNITDINYSRLNQLCKILKITIIELLSADKNFESSKDEIQNLKSHLADKNKEIIQLQKQIIRLLKE